MLLGSLDISPAVDGLIVSKRPSSKPLPATDSTAWAAQGGMFRTDGLKESTLGGFVIRTGDRIILVDAGGGEAHQNGFSSPGLDPDHLDDAYVRFFKGRGLSSAQMREFASDLNLTSIKQGLLPASLSKLGLHPADITDVVFTHLHWDHIGWASAAGTPFFANATMHCASADLDYFLSGPDEDWFSAEVFRTLSVRERLGPVLDRIETWDADRTLFPGVDVRLAPGHTPGSSVVVISSGNEKAMLLGDMVHCPLELMDDDFNLLGDHDQALADRVRTAYARELENTGVHIAAAHFPGLRFGRLLSFGTERTWTFADQHS